MALLRINATDCGLALHDTPQPARHRLCQMAAQPGPAVIMVHGYKYAPGSPEHCPHQKLFGTGAHSWPAQLGFGCGAGDEGLGIAFGWFARGSLRRAHKRAADLGASLAVIVALLRAHTPDRPIHMVAHSLGSEAVLSALAHLPSGTVDRIILLTGASFAGRAAQMLQTPAGRTAELLNVTSRENDVFDAAFESLVPAGVSRDRALGQGIDAPNAVTVQLDCPQTLDGFRHMGFDIAPAGRRICHWSAYRRPGVMPLYRQFLRAPADMPLTALARALPDTQAPRWSRLWGPNTDTSTDITLPPPPLALGLRQRLMQTARLRSGKDEPAY